jgi:hypothetical protein
LDLDLGFGWLRLNVATSDLLQGDVWVQDHTIS